MRSRSGAAAAALAVTAPVDATVRAATRVAAIDW
jgi:hypothetical protein